MFKKLMNDPKFNILMLSKPMVTLNKIFSSFYQSLGYIIYVVNIKYNSLPNLWYFGKSTLNVNIFNVHAQFMYFSLNLHNKNVYVVGVYDFDYYMTRGDLLMELSLSNSSHIVPSSILGILMRFYMLLKLGVTLYLYLFPMYILNVG